MKILIVEDNLAQLKDAGDTLESLGVEVVVATNFYGATCELEDEHNIDGVITDIFMPFSNEPKYDANEPCGVGVALWARNRKIPCVLCTDEWHHGPRLNWICLTARMLGIKLIDSGEFAQPTKKNWLRAFGYLKVEIEKTS